MLKSSWYDQFTIGDCLWKTHYDMKTSTWQSPTDDNMLGLKLVTVSAEGRVEHQKLNQTTALLLFGWVFGVQLDLLEKIDSPKTLNREEYYVICRWPLKKSLENECTNNFHVVINYAIWGRGWGTWKNVGAICTIRVYLKNEILKRNESSKIQNKKCDLSKNTPHNHHTHT